MDSPESKTEAHSLFYEPFVSAPSARKQRLSLDTRKKVVRLLSFHRTSLAMLEAADNLASDEILECSC